MSKNWWESDPVYNSPAAPVSDNWWESDPVADPNDPLLADIARKDQQKVYEEAGGGIGSSLKRGVKSAEQSLYGLAALGAGAVKSGLEDYPAAQTGDIFTSPETYDAIANLAGKGIQNKQKEINPIPQNPAITRAMEAANKEKGYIDPVEAFVSEIAQSPDKTGLFADLLAEQAPAIATTIAGTKGVTGTLETVAPRFAAKKIGQAAAVSAGAGEASVVSTFGTNVAEGLDKGLPLDEALARAEKKTAVQAAINAATAGVIPYKIGPSQLTNIPAQTALQMAGGGAGEYLSNKAVGEESTPGDIAANIALGVVGVPGEVAGHMLAHGRHPVAEPAPKAPKQEILSPDEYVSIRFDPVTGRILEDDEGVEPPSPPAIGQQRPAGLLPAPQEDIHKHAPWTQSIVTPNEASGDTIYAENPIKKLAPPEPTGVLKVTPEGDISEMGQNELNQVEETRKALEDKKKAMEELGLTPDIIALLDRIKNPDKYSNTPPKSNEPTALLPPPEPTGIYQVNPQGDVSEMGQNQLNERDARVNAMEQLGLTPDIMKLLQKIKNPEQPIDTSINPQEPAQPKLLPPPEPTGIYQVTPGGQVSEMGVNQLNERDAKIKAMEHLGLTPDILTLLQRLRGEGPPPVPRQKVPAVPNEESVGAGASAPTPQVPVKAGEANPPLNADAIPLKTFDPLAIKEDAKNFQFKSGTDEAGVTGKLKDVKSWNPVKANTGIVYEDLKGNNFIVDGHQRLGLAKRLKQENPNADIKFNAHVLREADGFSKADARLIAAEKNIDEGTGTALDAAKVIREAGADRLDVNPSSALYRKGDSLARLDDNTFGMVANGKLTEDQGAVIGRVAKTPEEQQVVASVVAKANPSTSLETEVLAHHALDAGITKEPHNDLFGNNIISSSNWEQKAKLIRETINQLKNEKKVFSTLVEKKGKITGAGNILDNEANHDIANSADKAAAIVEKLAVTKGEISDVFNQKAQEVANGKSIKSAGRELAEHFKRAFAGTPETREKPSTERPSSAAKPATKPTGQVKPEKQYSAAKPKEDANQEAPRFAQEKETLKRDVLAIAKRMNPDVKVETVDRLFGEGEALKRSGAETTAKQEVSGAYTPLQNLVEVSLSPEAMDPRNSAYHELFHSIENMLTPEEQNTLQKTYPGTDKMSHEEQVATAFADWATKRYGKEMLPRIRRVFSKVMQFLRDVGNRFKRGGVNSPEDVFIKAESGEIAARGKATDALRDAMAKGDIDEINRIINEESPSRAQIQQAIKRSGIPELKSLIVDDSRLSDNARAAYADAISSNSGDLAEKAYSLREEVFSKIPSKEKILKSTVEILRPFASEEFINKKLSDVETTLKNTQTDMKKDKSPTHIVNSLARMILTSNDAYTGFLEEKYKSPTIGKIKDFFYPDPGKAKSIKPTYFEEIDNYRFTNLNKLAKLVEGMKKEELNALAPLLQKPQSINQNTKEGRVAAQIAKMVKDNLKYLRDAGVEVGEVEGYFPRIRDIEKIVTDEKGFLHSATEAYLATYKEDASKANMSKEELHKEARTAAQSWLHNIMLEDDGITTDNNDFRLTTGKPPTPNNLKSRSFTKEADEILRPYLVQNPVDALSLLIDRTARKAAWENRFGNYITEENGKKIQGNRWADLKRAMIDEGVNGDGIGDVVRVIESNTGQMGRNIGRRGKTALAWMRLWSSMTFLPHAVIPSLVEPSIAGIRTGSISNALISFRDSFKTFIGSKDMASTQHFTEVLGLLGEMAEDMLMVQRSGDTIPNSNRKINYIGTKYFRATLLTRWTAATKVAAIRPLQYFIAKNSEAIVNGKNNKKSAEFFTSELGVPKDKIKDFAQWVMEGGGKKIEQSLVLGDGEMAGIYRNALRRAMDQTIMNATRATRERWANHPAGALAYSLTAYTIAFSKNLLIRNARLAKEATMGKGYSLEDRMHLLAPTLMLPILYGVARGIVELKGHTLKDPDAKEKTESDKELLALSISGLTGDLDRFINLFTSVKYSRDPATSLVGPILGSISEMIKSVVKILGNDSNTTNTEKLTEKRNLMRNLYNIGIAPMVSGALATYSPYAILAAAAIQVVSSPQLRAKFINATAGAKGSTGGGLSRQRHTHASHSHRGGR